MTFDTIIAVDWSARSAPSPARPTPDAIFACVGRNGTLDTPQYFRTRFAVMDWLDDLLDAEITAGRRVLAGFDFAFGYPDGFADALTGSNSGLAVWDWLSDQIVDESDNTNNRFKIADQINARFPGTGPFWGAPATVNLKHLPHKGTARSGHGMVEKRTCERASKTAQPVWKLYTTGAVGSQSLLGIPHLNRLRKRLGAHCAVWPMQDADTVQVTLCEIYPSLFPDSSDDANGILDARQVSRVVGQFFDEMPELPKLGAALTQEGWIVGLPIPEQGIVT